MKQILLLSTLMLALLTSGAHAGENWQPQREEPSIIIKNIAIAGAEADSAANAGGSGDNNRAASSAYAPTIYPTAPCMGSSSAGGQGLHFGVSFGTSWTDTECQINETARNFEQAGEHTDAMAVRCQGKYAAAAPSCQALRAKK